MLYYGQMVSSFQKAMWMPLATSSDFDWSLISIGGEGSIGTHVPCAFLSVSMTYKPRYVYKSFQAFMLDLTFPCATIDDRSGAPETKRVASRPCWPSSLVTVVETGIRSSHVQSFATLQHRYTTISSPSGNRAMDEDDVNLNCYRSILPRTMATAVKNMASIYTTR